MALESLPLVGWVVGAVLVLSSVQRVRDLLAVPPLPRAPEPDPAERRQRVSIIITARDEQARVEGSVRSALEQHGVDVEVIVVDDRSSDATPALLAALAQESPRLRVARVGSLPEGWLGKPNACRVGAELADGEWLLFSDADAWLEPGVVRRSLLAARDSGADHVCLIPGEADASVFARATLINFSAGLIHYASRANRDRPGSMFGVGAFNLVRTEAYRGIGGHRPLRLEVIDDLKLGWLLRRAGYRTRAYGAARDVEVHWSPSARQLIRAVEKNLFAMLGFSTARATLAIGGLTLFVGAALTAPFFGGAAGVVAVAGWLATLVPSTMMARRAGWGWLAPLLTPIVTPVMIAAIVRSTWVTLRQRGIRWRGTFYPLDALRRGRVGP